MGGPLDGVVVVDLTRLLPGPFASQLLCDLGATVIKVEDPSAGGDSTRAFPPYAPDGVSLAFHALNRGKLSIALCLNKAEDKNKLLKLLEMKADVLLESFRPGVLAAMLGLQDIDELMKRCPRLIVCSMSGYGASGPDSNRAGHDINYLARVGVLGMQFKPSPPPVQIADVAGGSWPAAVQILAGLIARGKSGKGTFIDVALAAGAYHTMVLSQAAQVGAGAPVGGGNHVLSGAVPCYDVYETKDGGYIAVGALEPKFFSRLVKILPNLKDHERDAVLTGQMATGKLGESVRVILRRSFASLETEEWAKKLENADAMCEVVRSPDGIAGRDAQLRARGVIVDVDINGRQIQLPGSPLCMTGVLPSNVPGPILGQHTEQILAKL